VGSTIVVFGGGAVGLSAIMAARLTTPAKLILVDNSQTKLDMIPKELLEDVTTINSAKQQPGQLVTTLKELSLDGQGPDLAIDCVGAEAVLIDAHAALTVTGMLITIGAAAGLKAGFSVEAQLAKGITYRGTHQGDSVSRVMVPQMIQLWRNGKFSFDRLLTMYKFEELQKAMDDTHAGRVIKPVLVM